jgi:hypothetical protein
VGDSQRLAIGFAIGFLSAIGAHAQGGEPSLAQFSRDEQSSIRNACYGASLLGPARYYRCLNAKSDELAKSPGPPDLSAHSRDEQASIRNACYGAGLLGPASNYRCLKRKSDELSRSPGEPDLSRYSRDEQASIRNACYGAGLLGPASYHRCLRAKAAELARWYPPPPSTPAQPAPEVSAPFPQHVEPSEAETVAPPTTLGEIAAALETASEPAVAQTEEPVAPEATPNDADGSETAETQQPPRGAAQPRTEVARPAAPRKPTPRPRRVAPPSAIPAPASESPSDPPLIIIFWGAIAIWLAYRWLRRSLREHAPLGEAQRAAGPRPGTQANDARYRPRRQTATARIRFGSVDVTTRQGGAVAASDVRDAVTGRVLDPTRELYQCTVCRTCYHVDSVDFLNRENGGACVSCGRSAVTEVRSGGEPPAGRSYDPAVTTLATVRNRVGQVVIFEGRCVEVRASRSGSTYAALFEHGTWFGSFKAVFLRDAVAPVGGPRFIHSLAGRTVRIRGLVHQHELYGYEILVNDRSMILGVSA